MTTPWLPDRPNVAPVLDIIERKRRIIQMVHFIAATEMLVWLEQTLEAAYAHLLRGGARTDAIR